MKQRLERITATMSGDQRESLLLWLDDCMTDLDITDTDTLTMLYNATGGSHKSEDSPQS